MGDQDVGIDGGIYKNRLKKKQDIGCGLNT
jgi:hypothetical protein